MRFYVNAAEEAKALARAAARAGCVVRALALAETAHGERAVGRVECPDGWAAARMLLALSIEDARTPGARDLALRIRRGAGGDEDFARAVHAYVKSQVAFVREVGEVFQGTDYTLAARAGDCDDHGRAVYAIAAAGGIPAALAFLHAGQGPTHALAALCPGGPCSYAETTVDAAYGEHPLAAAERLGLLRDRVDLSREVVTMTEKDLPPVPHDFETRQPADQVSLDAEALTRLGYLGAPESASPSDMRFRRALLAFQAAMGITADGLIGPQSRAVIASQLPPDEFGMTYRQHLHSATIGAAAPATATAHLSPGFFRGVWRMTQDFRARGAKLPPEAFLNAWNNESGIRPWSHLPETHRAFKYGYSGLNGMGNNERRAVGAPFDPSLDPHAPNGPAAIGEGYEKWIAMTAEEQLPFVRRFYESNVASFAGGNYGSLDNVGSLYLMNFLPAFMGHANDPDFVLARRDADTHGWYRDNAGLDVGNKGYIEVADMARVMARAQGGIYKEAKARLYAEGPSADDPPAAPPIIAGTLVALGVLGAGLAAWHYFGS